LFTSQPIAVVALSTAPECRPRAASAGAPTLRGKVNAEFPDIHPGKK
jgi:hypothetical protein